jgi:ornithine cyclodeaminase/alanine dehydrogenase-like protein (mu-crystallin family)
VVPVFRVEDVRLAVPPLQAYDAVRDAFVAHARGEWTMPPKVYVTNYPAGDFRAMPALGGGHALLKWVTSFPRNPARGLPTVTGLVLLSDAEDGRLLAVLDAAAVTALRTAAAAALAAKTLARPDASSFAVVGLGPNGAETARMLAALGHAPVLWDVEEQRRREVADELGLQVAGGARQALACDVVATVTPGQEPLYRAGELRAGQHVSLMGADGAGKAEVELAELRRGRLFCDDREQASSRGAGGRVRLFVDDWEQASHGGETAAAVEAGILTRRDVTELGAVLTGDAPGRQNPDDVTLFDSTGLAIQDLAVAKVALSRADELELPEIDL